jgi:murein DD-endopeptidase MepM/ murein hydrolase activator NlpD
VYVAKPQVAKVSCVRRCASRRRPQAGSTIAVFGSALDGARKLIFLGSAGRADDVAVPIRPASARRVQARVPVAAVSGPLSVYVSRSMRSRPSRSVPILPAPPPEPNTQLSAVPGSGERGTPRIETGTSRTRVFYGARRAVTFSYRITDTAPAQVTVELISARDGAVVATWDQGVVQPGEVRSIVWSGRALPGRYSFRLTAQGQGGSIARSAQEQSFERDAFDLYDHVFPIRGRHDYGGAGARFGAGRGGRSHQGQDVFARCGTRLVAARGGTVKYTGYHGAAGNYIVLDGADIDTDYAYMHLAEPSPFRAGDPVYTGQQIGSVGQTGNARGCHLHFEMWGAPGWYDGGRPFDPLPFLQAWDGWS